MTEPDETPRTPGHSDGPPADQDPYPPSTPPADQATAPDPSPAGDLPPSEAVTGPFDVVPADPPAEAPSAAPPAEAPAPEAAAPGYYPQHAPGHAAQGHAAPGQQPGQQAPQPAQYPPPGYPPQGYAPQPGYPPPGQAPYAPPGQAAYPPQGQPGYAPPPPGYAPQPGYYPAPGPGQPQYGYAPYPPAQHRPATAMPIYLTALLFLACAVFTLIIALTNWFGTPGPNAVAALVGLSFSGDITGNVDFAISASMTVGCTTATVALLLFFRLAFARWILVGLGALVIIAYVVGVIDLSSNGAGDYIALPIVALALWAGAVVVALLPITSRAFALTRRTFGSTAGPV